MSQTPTIIPRADYERARRGFAAFAEKSLHAVYFRRLLELSSPPVELPDGDVIASDLLVLGSAEAVRAALGPTLNAPIRLGRGPMAIALQTPAGQLFDFASRLDEGDRLSLDVMLRRALDPVEALASWPLEALFTPGEADFLRRLREEPPPVAGESPLHYRGFTCAILKLTRLCNLRCTYCHDWRVGADQNMPFEVQARALHCFLAPAEQRVAQFVWHGGEPTLLGRRGFLRFLMMQRWIQRLDQQIDNVIHTNATTVDAEWATFFKRYRLSVGVSLDGPPPVNDKVRLRVNGRGSSDQIRRGLAALRDAGLRPGLLVVLTPPVLAMGAAALHRFLQEEGVESAGLLAVRPGAGGGPDEAYLPREDFARFLVEVREARRRSPEPWVAIREIDSAEQAVRGRPFKFCELRGTCVGSYFSVEPDGSVAHCDKFVGDGAYTLGNVLHDSLSRIRSSEQALALAAQDRREVLPMESCPHFAHCRGWCPHERYVAATRDPGADPGCCGLRPLFEAIAAESEHG